jgi:predicted transcriptional regulator of viral defense system
MSTAHGQIEQVIKHRKKGELIFPTDFRGLGSEGAIKMTLTRLNKEGLIERLGHGIYLMPKTDPVFGKISPAPEEIANAIAKKEKIQIKPAGAYALHKLGLTTQVPTRLVYLTSGSAKEIKIGKTLIKFKATTPKKLAMKGKYSSLIVQALEELGTENIDSKTERRIKELLLKEDPKVLKEDLQLAPAKINDYLIKLI